MVHELTVRVRYDMYNCFPESWLFGASRGVTVGRAPRAGSRSCEVPGDPTAEPVQVTRCKAYFLACGV